MTLPGMALTHPELVKIAFDWLARRRRCSVVVSELVTSAGEVPDVIGWHGQVSTLVECKVSISDFRADQQKYERREPHEGMGNHRFYMVPESLEARVKDILPNGWGLLVPRGSRISLVRDSERFSANVGCEISMLISVIRRVHDAEHPIRGVGVNCYKHELAPAAPKACLSVASLGSLEP